MGHRPPGVEIAKRRAGEGEQAEGSHRFGSRAPCPRRGSVRPLRLDLRPPGRGPGCASRAGRVSPHIHRGFRAAMRWYYSIGCRVWPYELWHSYFHHHRTRHGPRLVEFWDAGGTVRQTRLSALPRQPEKGEQLRGLPCAPWQKEERAQPSIAALVLGP